MQNSFLSQDLPLEKKVLPYDFYKLPTLQVAQNLLGKILVFKGKKGRITETEAYIGQDDPACHAARGKTPRTQVMFGKAGLSYVYLIYGMYNCLNIVTEEEGFPAAVLIRGIHLLDTPHTHLNGPGKLCRHLGITRQHNALDMVNSNDFYVGDSDVRPKFQATSRIGIKIGLDRLWRFVDEDYVKF